jgi:hypothetical protein
MNKLPWTKLTIWSTPKMIVSPAEISQRYITVGRPMKPWKAIVSVQGGEGPAAEPSPRIDAIWWPGRA